jgi:hypothetical protein
MQRLNLHLQSRKYDPKDIQRVSQAENSRFLDRNNHRIGFVCLSDVPAGQLHCGPVLVPVDHSNGIQ